MKIKKREKKNVDIKVGLITERDLKTFKGKAVYTFIMVLVWLAVLICLIPSAWLITSAFKDVKEIHQVPPTFIPKSFNPGKVIEVWKRFNFTRYYMNTILLAIGQVSLSVLSNGLVAYTLSRLKPAGYKLMFGMIWAGFLLPAGVTLVSSYMRWMDFPILHINLLNTYWPFILGSMCAGGMTVLLFVSFFDNIPNSILEAAKLDGCGELATFFHIVLPVCKPILVTQVILSFNGTWGDFLTPYLYLSEKSKWTVMVYLYRLAGIQLDDRLVVLLFSMIPPLLVFFIFQKHIINGFTMSAVKE